MSYVREDQLALCPPMEPARTRCSTATASPRRPNSRLSCQLVSDREQMDGLVVDMPETQT